MKRHSVYKKRVRAQLKLLKEIRMNAQEKGTWMLIERDHQKSYLKKHILMNTAVFRLCMFF